MVLFALSFQDQVEKYGAYVGIAAFFGLAVLSLLYFSQARELKRLREWAGRAPERARELEQRVVAQATATVARRPPAMPASTAAGGIVPPRRLAEMPAAEPAAAGQATELADAVEADPATNGNVPAGPLAANGAVPAAEEGEEPAEGAAAPAGESGADPAVASPPGADPAVASSPTADPAGASSPGAGPANVSSPGAGPAGGVSPGAGPGVASSPGADPANVSSPDADPAGAVSPGADPAVASSPGVEPPKSAPGQGGVPASPGGTKPAEVAPGEVPPAPVPRATPAQRVGVTPRPAPAPLRQTKPTATPRDAGRRPAAPASRAAGAKPPREGRSAGTIALLVGLAVLILGGGAFLGSQVLGGDDEPPPPNQPAAPPTQTADGSDGGDGNDGSTADAPPPAETNVAVLNGTTFTGLAGQLADEVATEGYARGITETNTRDQTIQESVIYYADGFRASARAVGKLLSIEPVEPLDSETASLAPGANVVVLAGADQAP